MRADRGSDEAEEKMEERVRRVRHLDAFRCTHRRDGRFACHLDRPAAELSADELRAVLRALDRIRGRLERELQA